MLFPLLLIFFSCWLTPCVGHAKDLIILTDMQPDDRIALAIVAANRELRERLLLVGTSLLNAPLKAALARRQLKQMGLGNVPVFAGSGGPPNTYPNVASAKAAFTYGKEEGVSILSEQELEEYFMEGMENNNAQIDEDSRPLHQVPMEEMMRSILIEGLPESPAPKMAQKYKEDRNQVIRILDMLKVSMAPKNVYRMPRRRGILSFPSTAPRTLKVVFPVPSILALVVEEWYRMEERIRSEMKLPGLKIISALSAGQFERFAAIWNQKQMKTEQEEDKRGESQGNSETKKEYLRTITNEDLDLVRNIFAYDEEECSVMIKRLPEAEMLPANKFPKEKELLASERYDLDYEEARELLYKIGIEEPPVAVSRIGQNPEWEKGRNLKAVLRKKKLVEIVKQNWLRYFKLITKRKSKPEWEHVYFEVYKHRAGLINEATIRNKDDAIKLLEKLKNAQYGEDKIAPTNAENEKIKKIEDSQPNKLQIELERALQNARVNSLEILLLTSPIDLVQVLDRNRDLCKKVRLVHLMGGWMELNPPRQAQLDKEKAALGKTSKDQKPPPIIWENYNLSMAPESSRRLFAMASAGLLPMRLYSYSQVREMFNGSINGINFAKLFKILNESKVPVLQNFMTAAQSWDEHALAVMPHLAYLIGPNAGQQFSSADPMIVIGLLHPNFVQSTRSTSIQIEHEQLYDCDMLEVHIEYDKLQAFPKSKITLNTRLDLGVFREVLEHSIEVVSGKIGETGATDHGQLKAISGATAKSGKSPIKFANNRCYKCGKEGHKARECLDRNETNAQRYNEASGSKKMGIQSVEKGGNEKISRKNKKKELQEETKNLVKFGKKMYPKSQNIPPIEEPNFQEEIPLGINTKEIKIKVEERGSKEEKLAAESEKERFKKEESVNEEEINHTFPNQNESQEEIEKEAISSQIEDKEVQKEQEKQEQLEYAPEGKKENNEESENVKEEESGMEETVEIKVNKKRKKNKKKTKQTNTQLVETEENDKIQKEIKITFPDQNETQEKAEKEVISEQMENKGVLKEEEQQHNKQEELEHLPEEKKESNEEKVKESGMEEKVESTVTKKRKNNKKKTKQTNLVETEKEKDKIENIQAEKDGGMFKKAVKVARRVATATTLLGGTLLAFNPLMSHHFAGHGNSQQLIGRQANSNPLLLKLPAPASYTEPAGVLRLNEATNSENTRNEHPLHGDFMQNHGLFSDTALTETKQTWDKIYKN